MLGWRHMQMSDLANICQIADVCHPDFPERPDVLAEKLNLSPETCFVFETQKMVRGYLIAHPYSLGLAPALDCFLGTIPNPASTLYIHDIAILPEARASGIAAKAIDLVIDYAALNSITSLSLIAVNGSSLFWQKMGFALASPSLILEEKLKTYSDDAIYMTRSNI